MSESSHPYQLLTSARFDPFLKSLSWNNDSEGPSPFFLLPFHHDRLLRAASIHNWLYAKNRLSSYLDLKAACLGAVLDQQGSMNRSQAGAFKVRITVSKDGRVVVTASLLASSFHSDPTSLSLLKNPLINNSHYEQDAVKLYIDQDTTTPSVFTRTKTTFRDIYDNVKARNQKALEEKAPFDTSDVLLYNPNGRVMETTIFNVAFYRSGRWITPSVISGCLPGVMRRWLLENQRIFEDNGEEPSLTTESIQLGEWVLLFNGVQGCRLGKLFMSS